MHKVVRAMSWLNILTNVLMLVAGALMMAVIRLSFSLTEGHAAWASVIVTLLTGSGAVLGAFWLWRWQQADRARQLERIGLAIFDDVYHRLLELEVFTKYESWLSFYQHVHKADPPGEVEDVRRSHWEAAGRYIDALAAESVLSIENFSMLRDKLGDVEEEQLLVMLRLYTFLGGVPLQLSKIRKEWNELDGSLDPACLTPESQRILSYSIGACAFFLNKLDGGVRSKSEANLFKNFYFAQKEIHAGA